MYEYKFMYGSCKEQMSMGKEDMHTRGENVCRGLFGNDLSAQTLRIRGYYMNPTGNALRPAKHPVR